MSWLGAFDRVRQATEESKGGGLKLLGKYVGQGMKFFGTSELPALVPSKANPVQVSPDLTYKVLDDPFSHFSEGLRSVKTALDIMALTPARAVHRDDLGAPR